MVSSSITLCMLGNCAFFSAADFIFSKSTFSKILGYQQAMLFKIYVAFELPSLNEL